MADSNIKKYDSFHDLFEDNDPLTPDEIKKVTKTLIWGGSEFGLESTLARGAVYSFVMVDMTGVKGFRNGTLMTLHREAGGTTWVQWSNGRSKTSWNEIASGAKNGNLSVTDLAGVPYVSYADLLKKS